MTRQEIDAVLERVRTWPEGRQAYAAYVLLALEREDEEPYQLSADEEAALDEAEASGVASKAEVRSVLDRYRS